jgi:hypothetical protein
MEMDGDSKRDGVCTPSQTFAIWWNDRKRVRYGTHEKRYGRDKYPVRHII